MPGFALVLAPVAIATLGTILFTMGSFGSKKRSFAGKHAFITGGSEGIGRAIAEQLLLQGASQITILARSQGKLEQACDSLTQIISEKGLSASVGYQAADVTDWQQVRCTPPPDPTPPHPTPPHPTPPHPTPPHPTPPHPTPPHPTHRWSEPWRCCIASPPDSSPGRVLPQVQKAVAAAEAAGGPIDLLVCCAGTSTPGVLQCLTLLRSHGSQ